MIGCRDCKHCGYDGSVHMTMGQQGAAAAAAWRWRAAAVEVQLQAGFLPADAAASCVSELVTCTMYCGPLWLCCCAFEVCHKWAAAWGMCRCCTRALLGLGFRPRPKSIPNTKAARKVGG